MDSLQSRHCDVTRRGVLRTAAGQQRDSGETAAGQRRVCWHCIYTVYWVTLSFAQRMHLYISKSDWLNTNLFDPYYIASKSKSSKQCSTILFNMFLSAMVYTYVYAGSTQRCTNTAITTTFAEWKLKSNPWEVITLAKCRSEPIVKYLKYKINTECKGWRTRGLLALTSTALSHVNIDDGSYPMWHLCLSNITWQVK